MTSHERTSRSRLATRLTAWLSYRKSRLLGLAWMVALCVVVVVAVVVAIAMSVTPRYQASTTVNLLHPALDDRLLARVLQSGSAGGTPLFSPATWQADRFFVTDSLVSSPDGNGHVYHLAQGGESGPGPSVWPTDGSSFRDTPGVNLLDYSAELDNLVWAREGTLLTPDAAADPIDGAQTASYLSEGGATETRHGLGQQMRVTAGTVYSFSIFAKAGVRTQILVELGGPGLGSYAWFDLQNGVVTRTAVAGPGAPVTATIEPAGNGWYRCGMTQAANSSGDVVVKAYLTNRWGRATYAGTALSGTAVTGKANYVLLGQAASEENEFYTGSRITITGGKGAGQVRTIIHYSGVSKAATVDTPWDVTLNATSTYAIDAGVYLYGAMVNEGSEPAPYQGTRGGLTWTDMGDIARLGSFLPRMEAFTGSGSVASFIDLRPAASVVIRQLGLTMSEAELLSMVKVVPATSKNTASIVVTSSRPEQTAEIANAFADRYVHTQIVAVNAALQDTRQDIRTQLETLASQPSADEATISQLQLDDLTLSSAVPGRIGLGVKTWAVTPSRPSYPRTTEWVVLGILVGVFLGLVLAFLREALTARLRGKPRA